MRNSAKIQTVLLMIPSDSTIKIPLDASACAFGSFGKDGSASAEADRYLHIDRSFPPAGEFTLSDGVGNSPLTSVPETSTLPLLSIGLSGFGLLRHRDGSRSQSRFAYA
jgi:hypothetical protein